MKSSSEYQAAKRELIVNLVYILCMLFVLLYLAFVAQHVAAFIILPILTMGIILSYKAYKKLKKVKKTT